MTQRKRTFSRRLSSDWLSSAAVSSQPPAPSKRPNPPCPAGWWEGGGACNQGCPSNSQQRSNLTGRCLCGGAPPNDKCIKGSRCGADGQCVDSASTAAPPAQPASPNAVSSGMFGNVWVEAPAIFKRGSTYYALFGECCCFCKNGSGVGARASSSSSSSSSSVNSRSFFRSLYI